MSELDNYFKENLDRFRRKFKYLSTDSNYWTLLNIVKSIAYIDVNKQEINQLFEPFDYKLHWLISKVGASKFLLSLMSHLMNENGKIFDERDEVFNADFYEFAKVRTTDDGILDIMCEHFITNIFNEYIYTHEKPDLDDIFFTRIFNSRLINYLFLDVITKYEMEHIKKKAVEFLDEKISFLTNPSE